ncbi:hypothetical protein AVEN_192394-1 [Araneus ventricosus]|uniref:Uncharacterized protein n=1 Tax=Araneus ventricosus TaxID=182803 RepID=A0A4Y2H876_ARAVE|nr:hypothetical protein AVEN_192394-1 [Araneus ventricosus]
MKSTGAKHPPMGVVRKLGEGMAAQVLSSSSDRGLKLRGPSQNSGHVAAKLDINIIKLTSLISVHPRLSCLTPWLAVKLSSFSFLYFEPFGESLSTLKFYFFFPTSATTTTEVLPYHQLHCHDLNYNSLLLGVCVPDQKNTSCWSFNSSMDPFHSVGMGLGNLKLFCTLIR